jgi:hypothetical protein
LAIAKKEIRGLIQGRTVMLDDDPGLPDGQPVIVIPAMQPASEEEGRMRLLRAAGTWAGDDEGGLDKYLEWVRQQRKVTRPEIEG